ncbi:MAG: hypothetical protein V1736_03465 [Pseudomonadota bacterium]
MTQAQMKSIASNGIKLVAHFFADLTGVDRNCLPPVLRTPGHWMASYDNHTLGIFFLDRGSLKRVTDFQNKGWPPFPGFLISDATRPPGSPVAVEISGSCNVFSSIRTTNMFTFSVKPGASFVVVDHFQEIKDSSGQEFKYKVDLAFILGIIENESWEDLQIRLADLLQHSLKVWRQTV